MEVLLLDTTEKEGEDNTLYHCVHNKKGVGCFSTLSTGSGAHWLDLRGVLAAAVGATTSLCGEPLRFARFDTNGSIGIVGFVNIYEVLYALVFPSTNLPESIVQYYTRSSCDLLLSFFGYPGEKLNQWRRRDGRSISSAALTTQLDTLFKGIFSVTQHDLSFCSDLHFAFEGRIPAVNYPLETMAKLAVLDIPFGDTTTSAQYSVIGRSIFYRKRLAFSTMRSDLLRLLFQWLLVGENFAPDSTATKPSSNNDGSLTRLNTFELHDFRFTRHGNYPKRHAFLIITRENLQLGFLLERKLELEGEDGTVSWAKHFADSVDEYRIDALATFCTQHLEEYLKTTQLLRHRRTEALQSQFADELQREPELPRHEPSNFLWYSVALDRLRGVIIGDELRFFDSNDNDHKIDSQVQSDNFIMAEFVKKISSFQQSLRCMYDAIPDTSPELPSGIPPLKLNVDDPGVLFLREKAISDAGDDISTGDAHIFPPSHNIHETYEKQGRAQRQTAEQIAVGGRPFWVIAILYETLEFFSIVDAALPLDLLDHELNRLCAFGGAETAEELYPRNDSSEVHKS